MKIYALLNICRQCTFVLKESLTSPCAKGIQTLITVKNLNGEVTNKSAMLKGIKISTSSMKELNDWLVWPPCQYSKKHIPVDKNDIASPSK